MNTFNSIINHTEIPKNVVEALYRLDERFILIRNSAPQYFFLGSSMTKKNNYNTILRLAYGEPEVGDCECESEDEGNFNEDDLIKALSSAGFIEKENESRTTGDTGEPSEPSINEI
jgi:hypothetical protein